MWAVAGGLLRLGCVHPGSAVSFSALATLLWVRSRVGSKGYRPFLAMRNDDTSAIDCVQAEKTAKFGGIFMSRFVYRDSPVVWSFRATPRFRGASV
jgi:hypothetical protein